MFAPQGTVKEIRQVTARFSEPMVSFGDPQLADPFDIRCAEKGSGRWVDARTWSYDFERNLPGGVACRFALKAGVKTLAGTAVTVIVSSCRIFRIRSNLGFTSCS